MATTPQIFGQTADASTEVTLYTVPMARSAKVRVVACNRSTAATYRIALVQGGGTTANEDYVAYDAALADNEALTSNTLTLAAGDVVRVLASTATVSFTAYGIEQS